MAVQTSAGLQNVADHTATSALLSSNLDSGPEAVNASPPATMNEDAALALGIGVFTDNKPVAQLARAMGSGYRAPSFKDDYYDRVHIIPSFLDLGNLLSSQQRSVEIWNAYSVDKLLASVDEDGTQGITETYDVQDPPTTFNALEARNLALNISTNGPPTVNAVYTFDFPDEDPTLTLVGRRVTIWSFDPDSAFSEELLWETDIIRPRANEQRIALRTAPRQALSYTFEMDEQQFSRAKAISTLWAQRVYGVPVWDEGRRVGALSAGITTIPMDTANADYRADSLVLVWEADDEFEAVELETVNANSLDLKLALDRNYANAFVAPMRLARTLQGTSFTRSHNKSITASARFLVTDNIDLGDESSFDEYLSVRVLTDRTVVLDDVSERIARAVDIIDNGSGPIVVDTQKDFVDFRQQVSLSGRLADRKWLLRQWLHARRGRQRSFWLPSWNRDLVVATNIGSASPSITTDFIGYSLYYSDASRYILLRTKAGATFYKTVTGGTDNEDGTETLSIDSAFGVAINVEDVDFVCFMSHVRLDTDSVTLDHVPGGRMTFSATVTEVPL